MLMLMLMPGGAALLHCTARHELELTPSRWDQFRVCMIGQIHTVPCLWLAGFPQLG